MMLRLKMMRRRKTNPAGTLICAACGARFQFALWEGRRCKRCFDKRAVISEMDPELRLQANALLAECRERFGYISITALANRLEIRPQTLLAWANKQRTDRVMAKLNARVRAALDKLTKVAP